MRLSVRRALAFLGAIAIRTMALAQDPVPIGSEFQVNTYTTGHQSGPAISSDPIGQFVVVWSSYGQDGSGNGVFAQRYTSDANQVGTEFGVNSFTGGHQNAGDVIVGSDGQFVIAWTDSALGDGSNTGVFAARFDSIGTPLGTEFQVNTYTTGRQDIQDMAGTPNGDFVIAWVSPDQDGSDEGIFGQRYASDGIPLGSEFQINTYTSGPQSSPRIASASTSEFMIVWESPPSAFIGPCFLETQCPVGSDCIDSACVTGRDGSGGGVFGQRYASSGLPSGTEFQVNTYTTGNQLSPSISSDIMGGFTVVWEARGNLPPFNELCQTDADCAAGYECDATCCPSSPAIPCFVDGDCASNQFCTAGRCCNAYTLCNGDCACVFVAPAAGICGIGVRGIFGQRFDSGGNSLGSEFQITSSGGYAPEMASSTSGITVITWFEDNAALGRLYDSTGTPVGEPFELVSNIQSDNRRLAFNGTSKFTVVWETHINDGSGLAIAGQQFSLTPLPTATPEATPPPMATPTITICASTPQLGCRTAPQGVLAVKGSGNAPKFIWKWLRGDSDLASFGNPVSGPTDYAVCVYDSVGGNESLSFGMRAPAASTCGGDLCWRPTGTTGFKYVDPEGTHDGIARITLKASTEGKAKVLVKGVGNSLPIPAPVDANNLFRQDPVLRVQLVNAEGQCWEAVYASPARKMTGDQFKDKL